MKNKLLSAALLLLVSLTAFAEDPFPAGRVAATHTGEGNDRNGDGVVATNLNQSGTSVPGSYTPSEQVQFCEKCEHRKLLLSDVKDHARPGVQKATSGGSPSDESGVGN